MLFQIDLTGASPEAVFEEFWTTLDAAPEVRTFAQRIVRGVWSEKDDLDRRIAEAAENWRLERMAAVDRNVLRAAVFEMTHDPETPRAVVIDEAIEIAKKYGSEDSGKFINGILDAIRRRADSGTA